MNCCLQNILHINLHILYIIHIKTSSKIQELQESNKYIKSYQQNKFELLEKYYFNIRYLLPLANLATQTEFSQWEKVCSG